MDRTDGLSGIFLMGNCRIYFEVILFFKKKNLLGFFREFFFRALRKFHIDFAW